MQTLLKRILLLTFICSSLLGSESLAQKKYKLYASEEGIEVYARWEHEKMFHKGPMLLCICVKNTTESAVTTSMDINFYNVAVMAESSSVEALCIPAGKKAKGRKAGLCFKSEKFSNEQLMEEAFHWKVEEIKVTEEAGCE